MKNVIRKLALPAALLLVGFTVFTGCESGEKSEGDLVDSGTYTGTVEKVEASKDEIYVKSGEDTLELYFTEQTKLTKGGETVEFSALKKGQEVEVKVEKKGKRLDPISVKILK
jgi:uncharacterized cupredoxin-like copper-binding protein